MYSTDGVGFPWARSANGTDLVLVVALCRPVIVTCEVPNNMAKYS